MRRTAPLFMLAFLISLAQADEVTENHKALQYFVGRWDVATTMWGAPGSPPTRFRNTCQGELIMDGRFIRMSYQGERMGRPFEALQIIGYDVSASAYKTVIIDNTSSGVYVLTGRYDPIARTYIYEGTWPTPEGGAIPFRSLIRIVGPDEYTVETLIVLAGGEEFKAIEERNLRKK